MKSVQQYNDSLNEGKTLDAKKFNKLKSDSDRVKYLKDIYGGEINGEDFYSPDEEPEKVKANKTLDKMIDSGILSVEDEDEFIYGFNESKLDEGINITPKNFIKDIKPLILRDKYPTMVDPKLFDFTWMENKGKIPFSHILIGSAEVAFVAVLETLISARIADNMTGTRFE